MTSVDVAIVGAGAAGIGCARELIARGRSVVILEALDRVGGRAWTTQVAGVPVDVGAQFVHAADHGNPWTDIALAMGVPIVAAPRRRIAHGQGGGDVDLRIDRALAAVGHATPGESVATVLAGPDPLGAVYAGSWLCGADPEQIDAADLAEAHGGEDWLLPRGYGDLVTAVAEGLPIRLSTPVSRITERRDRVQVETSGGTIEARHAVVTVSTSALAAGGIEFAPALPDRVRRALTDLPCGNLVKIALVLRDTALADVPPHFALDAEPGPASPLLHVRPAGMSSVVAFLGGSAGDEVDAISDDAAIELAADALVRLVGATARGDVVAGHVSRWTSSPWFRGSYSNALPGRHVARSVLRTPFADRIHYAGEAAAPRGWQATVAGAWLSGRAVARRIASA